MQRSISRGYTTRILASCVMVVMGWAHPACASESFARFAGVWRGSGSIVMDDGSREPIRCKAVYAVRPDGGALNIDMNCASDSYGAHILTRVAADGSGFSGSWQETTRQAQGTVTGRISNSREMTANLQAVGVALQFTAHVDGARQAIRLHVQGTDIQEIDIILHR